MAGTRAVGGGGVDIIGDNRAAIAGTIFTLEVNAGMQNVIMQHGSIFTLEVNAGMQNVIMQHGSIFTLEVNAGMQNVIMQHGSIFTFSLFQFENIHLCELQIFTQFIKIPMKCVSILFMCFL
jgi:hypothetical protein